MDWDEDEVTGVVPVVVHETAEQPLSAYFIVLAGSGVGEMFKLRGQKTVIGRSRKADILILDDAISRIHCEVIVDPSGDILLKDHGSKNGTFVNGRRVDSHVLKDGDKVQVGSTTILKFTLNDDLEESFQLSLYEAALRDGLTKAFNKKYFTERLLSEFSYSVRHGTYLTLLMMDLDHFKHINDNHGHLAGDYVLQTIAQQVLSSIRTEDVFARYGGEEFVLIARGIRSREGAIVAERLRSTVERKKFHHNNQMLAVTISIGVAGIPNPDIKTPEDLVAAADKALYAAKHGGRNQVTIYKE